MKKTRLILTRHGKTAWNLESRIQGMSDTPLHKDAIEETQKSAHKLKKYNIDRIYTSKLLRTIQTAQIINEILGIPYIEAHPKLHERSFGPYEGLSWKEIDEKFFSKGIDFFHDKIEGVEDRSEFIKRVTNALNEIGKKHHGETILLVTHGGVISATIKHFSPSLIVEGIPNNSFFLLEHDTKIISQL